MIWGNVASGADRLDLLHHVVRRAEVFVVAVQPTHGRPPKHQLFQRRWPVVPALQQVEQERLSGQGAFGGLPIDDARVCGPRCVLARNRLEQGGDLVRRGAAFRGGCGR
jgi:hypothetical protein